MKIMVAYWQDDDGAGRIKAFPAETTEEQVREWIREWFEDPEDWDENFDAVVLDTDDDEPAIVGP